MMTWFRSKLINAHKRQREHLYWILDSLTEDQMTKDVTEEEYISSIMKTLRHIGNAETYWFHKSGHSIGPPISDNNATDVIERLKGNTSKIEEVIITCEDGQLEIRSGMNKQTPTVAWALLRTYQHGIYHSGHIAKLRHIIGAPSLPTHKDELWSSAVDAIIEIIMKMRLNGE
jgi:hypothetical protein